MWASDGWKRIRDDGSCGYNRYDGSAGHDFCLKLLIAAGANLDLRDKVRKCATASGPVKCAYSRIVVVIVCVGQDGWVEGLGRQSEEL